MLIFLFGALTRVAAVPIYVIVIASAALAALLVAFILSRLTPAAVVRAAGFAWDPEQDIFYSVMNPWQRRFGYCDLYDEAAPPASLIFDREPIRFEFEGKRWLVELWKGQYGITTGAEIGVYTTAKRDINIPGVFSGPFYGDTRDSDHLVMSIALIKDGRVLFCRSARHWWLTGFALGEFSWPGELTLCARIRLKNIEMFRVFVEALKQAGYEGGEYFTCEEECYVDLWFSRPHSPQPRSREVWEQSAQERNRLLCEAFNALADGAEGSVNKLAAVKKQDRRLYREITRDGMFKSRYRSYRIPGNGK